MGFVIMIAEDGVMYRLLRDPKPIGRCYKCDYYTKCTKSQEEPCRLDGGKKVNYLKRIPLKSTLNLEDITFTKTRVKYKGQMADKCLVKSLLHDTEFMLGCNVWPLISDIYWYDMRYANLKESLEKNVTLLKGLIAISHY